MGAPAAAPVRVPAGRLPGDRAALVGRTGCGGVPTGVMDEPAVTLFRPGPAAALARVRGLAAAGDRPAARHGCRHHARARPRRRRNSQVIARHRPDATVGALRGLPGLGMGEDFPARDQRDDDRRSVTVTSAPLRAGIVVGGRPEVSVRLGRGVGRLVARLTDVHPDGRSVLITAGVLCPGARRRPAHAAAAPDRRPGHGRAPVAGRGRATPTSRG